MVLDIQSKEVIDKISDELKVQPSLQIPRELMDKIQLVYNVNPFNPVTIIATAAADNSTAAVVFTTPAERDFYLTSVILSVIKDVNSTSTRSSMNVRINEVNTELIHIAGISVTAQNDVVSLNYNPPIKLSRGGEITVNNTTAVSKIVARASITGYTTDPQ